MTGISNQAYGGGPPFDPTLENMPVIAPPRRRGLRYRLTELLVGNTWAEVFEAQGRLHEANLALRDASFELRAAARMLRTENRKMLAEVNSLRFKSS